MPLPWNKQVLASYWIPAVGIGKPPQWVPIPLSNIGNYVLPSGRPQTQIVILGFAKFTGTPSNFSRPYFSIEEGVLKAMTLQPGQKQTEVQYLRSLGIKVLLSVQGYQPNPKSPGMGWDGVPAGKNDDFAQWVKTDIIEKYGLDGIDIDNEWSGLRSNPQNLVNTVAALRKKMPDTLISKALWSDFDDFKVSVTGSPDTYFSNLLDFGGIMAYGYPFEQQISTLESYVNIKIMVGGKEKNVGMKRTQVCIGVQAGPIEDPDDWMTPIDEVAELAQWVVNPKTAILGMMLYTFTSDIQQWTHWPQNDAKYMYPNPNDHAWQKTIIQGMWGPRIGW